MGKPTKSKTETAKIDGDTESKEPGSRDAHVVILKSGVGFFGIDINLVQEIVLIQPITKVPGSASRIAGMVDLRGRVIPVAEFATLLNHEPVERDDDTRILVVEHDGGHIGLIVDAVTEVTLIDADKIEGEASAGAQDHAYIVGVARMEDRLVSLVDIGRLLESADKLVEAIAPASTLAA